MENFDLGRLLRDTILYGLVSLSAEASGQGLDMKTIKANFAAEATRIYLNEYNYQHLTINGTVNQKEIIGKISLNDENAVFDLDGLVNFNANQERLMFRFNLKGADLQKLRFSQRFAGFYGKINILQGIGACRLVLKRYIFIAQLRYGA